MHRDAPHVTVTLTAIASRLPTLPITIRSLLAQDYARFEVVLYLSDEPYLLDAGIGGVVPAPLALLARGSGGAFSIRIVPNMGPYRKLLPFLGETFGQRRLVATADDDTVYPPDWLSRMVAAYEKRRCIVCHRAHFMRRGGADGEGYRGWMAGEVLRNPDIDVLPTGKDGVLYDTIFFHPRVIDYATAREIAPTADDLWFKWHSAAVGVSAYVIDRQGKGDGFGHHGFRDSLFHAYNRGGGNDAALAALSRYGREVLAVDL